MVKKNTFVDRPTREKALSHPRAAGIAKENGATYTAVTRPADVLTVVDKFSDRSSSLQVSDRSFPVLT
jgi:hypothetical protein